MDRDGTGSQRNLSREIIKPISYLYYQSINQVGVPLTETNQERASLLLPARGLRFPFLDAFKSLNPQEKASYPQKNRLMHRVIHRKGPPFSHALNPQKPHKAYDKLLILFLYIFIPCVRHSGPKGAIRKWQNGTLRIFISGRSGNGKTVRSGFAFNRVSM